MLIIANVQPASDLHDTIAEAIRLCNEFGHHDTPTPFYESRNFKDFLFTEGDSAKPTVRFHFNGVTICVQADSDRELIFHGYRQALKGHSVRVVGPHPEPDLDAEERASANGAP